MPGRGVPEGAGNTKQNGKEKATSARENPLHEMTRYWFHRSP